MIYPITSSQISWISHNELISSNIVMYIYVYVYIYIYTFDLWCIDIYIYIYLFIVCIYLYNLNIYVHVICVYIIFIHEEFVCLFIGLLVYLFTYSRLLCSSWLNTQTMFKKYQCDITTFQVV